VTFPQSRRRTLITMTMVAAVCALAMATWVGYYVGRRTGSRPSSWKIRTSRVGLSSLVISLLVSITARRIRQRFWIEHMRPVPAGIWGLRTAAPLHVLRGHVARLRAY
jgi:VIT1/CCC1 family predicted Fe2+/Mn2+ transporter